MGKKSPLKKAKEELWKLCREETFKRHGENDKVDCYTCPATNLTGSNRQCGHFIAKSVCSIELAYDLDNLRPQCFSCNIWKSGNWIAFEEHLIKDKGEKFVAALKKKNRDTKGVRADLLWFKKKISEYKNL